jgi:hypothetical protein
MQIAIIADTHMPRGPRALTDPCVSEPGTEFELIGLD